jgi:hypothetical protein
MGVRDMDDLSREGMKQGLHIEDVIPMPADNFTLIWRRA